MEIRWDDVPDDVFEEVVAALLRAMGYRNVVVRTGGADDGWDTDAERHSTLPDGSVRVERWRVECKRYRGAVPAEKVRDHYSRMVRTPPRPEDVLFVTSAALSNPVKRDLEGFAAEDRVGVHWWEGEQLSRLAARHLSDPALRALLAPYVDSVLPFGLLRDGAAHQVATEIERRVGRKYIPALYRAREVDAELEAFIAAPRGDGWVEDLARYGAEIASLARKQGLEPAWSEMIESLRGAPSPRAGLAALDQATERMDAETRERVRKEAARRLLLWRNCFVIRDRAGSGKTSLLCHAATRERPEAISLLLSCRFDLREAAALEEVVLGALRAAVEAVAPADARMGLPRDGGVFLPAMLLALQQSGTELVVFLDGINENRDLRLLDEAVVSLLQRWNGFPVRFVVTCRDIFWEFFRPAEWEPFLYRGRVVSLPGFPEGEVDHVIQAYFAAFGIRGRVTGTARERCRHPLLLRFFCEAYQGLDVREFEDLRLKELFDAYWKRKRVEIGTALGWGGGGERRVEAFVLALVGRMVETHATQVRVGDIGAVTGEADFETQHSLYRRLLDEDVILEELPPANAFDQSYDRRKVAFVYDEFYDYMAALAYVRHQGWDDLSPAGVVQDFLRLLGGADRFEQLVGVAEYLVVMSEAKGLHRALCAALARLGAYDLLCSALPKLRDRGPWMADVLRACFLDADRGWEGTHRREALSQLAAEAMPPMPLAEHLLRAVLPGTTSGRWYPPASPENTLAGLWSRDPAEVLRSAPSAAEADAEVEPLGIILGAAGAGKTMPRSQWLEDPRIQALYRELVLDLGSGLTFRHAYGTQLEASRRIADAAWVLWDVDEVWEVLDRWSREERLTALCHAVVGAGFEGGHIDGQGTLEVLTQWLAGTERELLEGAGRLLPGIPSEALLAASREWGSGGQLQHLEALPVLMRHLFAVNSPRALALLAQWAGERPPRLDAIIVATLDRIVVPEGRDRQYYRLLERSLFGLKLRIGKRSEQAQRRIDGLISRARVQHSRCGERGVRGARGPRPLGERRGR